MSLFNHNKCGKITIKHWELDLFFILLIWGVNTHPPAYGPALLAFAVECRAVAPLLLSAGTC